MSDDLTSLIARWKDRAGGSGLTFELDVHAVSKERPRTGAGGHVYTPKKTQDFEKKVAKAALAATGGSIFTGPVKIHVTIIEKIPDTWPEARKILAKEGLIFPTRGDLDNKVKAITDGMNGYAYIDDSQIMLINASKVYGNDHKIRVTVDAVGLSPQQVDHAVHSIKALTRGKGQTPQSGT